MATRAPTDFDLRRDRLAAYFDGTARKAWIDLTSDAKVSGIRATVRAGRDEMRGVLLGWLPANMAKTSLLDAGCGTGALAAEAAIRQAHVIAVDVAGGLVDIARQRTPSSIGRGSIDWRVGDMLDPSFGEFDHVVAMDSLIHYAPQDLVDAVERLAARCRRSLSFTFAPLTPLLGAMHRVGKLFPRSDRSPAIVPIAETKLRMMLARLEDWEIRSSHRVSTGFYISHALNLVKRG